MMALTMMRSLTPVVLVSSAPAMSFATGLVVRQSLHIFFRCLSGFPLLLLPLLVPLLPHVAQLKARPSWKIPGQFRLRSYDDDDDDDEGTPHRIRTLHEMSLGYRDDQNLVVVAVVVGRLLRIQCRRRRKEGVLRFPDGTRNRRCSCA